MSGVLQLIIRRSTSLVWALNSLSLQPLNNTARITNNTYRAAHKPAAAYAPLQGRINDTSLRQLMRPCKGA
eukprot:2910079-Heterocapsa_arctica.AAC.1